MGSHMDKTGDVERESYQKLNPLITRISSKHNYTKSSYLQKRGIDLVLWNNDRQLTFEIKATDSNKPEYKTMFCEVCQDVRTCSPGFMYMVESDYLLWIYLSSGRIHLLKWKPFKHWFEANLRNYPTHYKNDTDTKWDTVGILIPWYDIGTALGKHQYGTFYLDHISGWEPRLTNLGLA